MSDDDFGYVLSPQPKVSSRPRHPQAGRIQQLWSIFQENVDPLTKVVHVPELDPAMQRACSDAESVSRSFEALMFAVYSAAVMSLSDDECKALLNEPRKRLLASYIASTRVALSRAKIMSTTDIVVLQALILHLLSIREIHEPRAVWSLTGVAVRIAQSMGLERDGSSLALSAYETEMRRRIWWQLRTLDSQVADLCGLSKFRDCEMGPDSTKWPTNINDAQLQPGMVSPPAASNTLTDVCFVALRYELVSFAANRVNDVRKQGGDTSQWEQHVASEVNRTGSRAVLREMEDHIETKYLRYCDPSQPLHLMTMLLARSAINTVQFMTHHPRRWRSPSQMPVDESQFVWEASIKLLEYHNMLHSNPQLKQFAWSAAFVLQWHAFIYLLDTLRAHPLRTDADKAWRLIASTYENNQAMIMDTWKPIHAAVAGLCLKAFDIRTAAVSQGKGLPAQATPKFILKLRGQQRTAASKKRNLDTTDRTPYTHTPGGDQLNLDLSTAPIVPNFVSSSIPLHMHQSASVQHGDVARDSAAYSNSNHDGSQYIHSSKEVHPQWDAGWNDAVESDAWIYASWEQWDTWLADSIVRSPFSPST